MACDTLSIVSSVLIDIQNTKFNSIGIFIINNNTADCDKNITITRNKDDSKKNLTGFPSEIHRQRLGVFIFIYPVLFPGPATTAWGLVYQI